MNRGSHCYANASIHSLLCRCIMQDLWRSAQSGIPVAAPAFGRFLQAVPGNARVELWKVKAWQNFMLGWTQPHLQHDAAEFLQFLSRLCVETMLGTWLALQETDAAVPLTVDQGSFWPLLLPATLSDSTLPDTDYTTILLHRLRPTCQYCFPCRSIASIVWAIRCAR